jgi:hypothetical protein
MKRLALIIAAAAITACGHRYESPTSPKPQPAAPLRIVLQVDRTSNNRCLHGTSLTAQITGSGYLIPPLQVRREFPTEVMAPNNKDFVVTYWQDDDVLAVFTTRADVGQFNTDAVTVDLSCVR